MSEQCYDIRRGVQPITGQALHSVTNRRPALRKGEQLPGDTGSVSGEPVMMAVIMQKCDDTLNVATDDRTVLPSERGAVLFLFAYLNRIIMHF